MGGAASRPTGPARPIASRARGSLRLCFVVLVVRCTSRWGKGLPDNGTVQAWLSRQPKRPTRRTSHARCRQDRPDPGCGRRNGGPRSAVRRAAGAVADARRAAPPVPMVTAPVQQQDVSIILSGLGTVQALNTATIRSQVTGMLRTVDFTEGQQVRRGATLAQIDPGRIRRGSRRRRRSWPATRRRAPTSRSTSTATCRCSAAGSRPTSR